MAADLLSVFIIIFYRESAVCMEDFAPCKIVHTKRLGYIYPSGFSHGSLTFKPKCHLFICLTLFWTYTPRLNFIAAVTCSKLYKES